MYFFVAKFVQCDACPEFLISAQQVSRAHYLADEILVFNVSLASVLRSALTASPTFNDMPATVNGPFVYVDVLTASAAAAGGVLLSGEVRFDQAYTEVFQVQFLSVVTGAQLLDSLKNQSGAYVFTDFIAVSTIALDIQPMCQPCSGACGECFGAGPDQCIVKADEHCTCILCTQKYAVA